VYVIAATVEPGWSGGPVVDSNGDVIAVIVGLEQRTGVTLAVPIEYLPTP
jgi:S1-C subfamily serine protease